MVTRLVDLSQFTIHHSLATKCAGPTIKTSVYSIWILGKYILPSVTPKDRNQGYQNIPLTLSN